MRAAIFDMDGLLIDSEPHWRAAEISVFAQVGVTLTEAECLETTGLRIDEVVGHWFVRRPWTGRPPGQVAAGIVEELIARIRRAGQPMPGAEPALQLVRARSDRVGLASSSSRPIIAAVLERLGLTDFFDAVHSADEERYGKPHPAVYLATCERLGAAPTATVALEDSINGVLAAKAGRLRCLAVPEAHHRHDPRFAIADARIDSLVELDPELWERLSALPSR
jgi:HAD superfamily hydrolase (TIGR01509 family)